MYLELKENRPHGTLEYPYTQYHIRNVKKPFQIPVHWHEELEIIYVHQGTLHVTINGIVYEGTKSSIFIVNPRELHFMGGSDLSVAYYTILFPLEFISFQTADALEKELLSPLRNGHLLFSSDLSGVPDCQALCEILDELIHINREQLPNIQTRCRILLLEFIEVLIGTPDFIHSATADNSSLPRELLSYLQQNYLDKISLQELAAHFHLSEKYVSRYFKKQFHLNFTQYLNHLRLTHARNLLETTDLPITDIALCSGFPSVSYFIRSFKSNYGVTPRKYRVSKNA